MTYSRLGAAHRVLVSSAAAVVLIAACDLDPSAPRDTGVEASLDISTANPGSWSTLAPIPLSRVAMSSGVIRNAAGQDIMYVIGGDKFVFPFEEFVAVRRMDAYNATTNTWTRKADFPTKAVGPAEAVGGRLYVMSGTSLYVYTPQTNTWARKADVPTTRGYKIVAISSRLYLLSSPQQLYRYNPATNIWTRRADMPRNHGGGVASAINEKLYAAWGPSPTVDEYDPATNRWTKKHTMLPADWCPYIGCGPNQPFNLGAAQGITLNQQLYAVAPLAVDSEGEFYYPGWVFAYSPAMNKWSKKATMGVRRSDLAVGKVKNAAGVVQIIATGGWYQDEEPYVTRATEAFTP